MTFGTGAPPAATTKFTPDDGPDVFARPARNITLVEALVIGSNDRSRAAQPAH